MLLRPTDSVARPEATVYFPGMSDASTTPVAPLLEMQGISKSFSGVQVLSNVSLRVQPGEVLALLGENGAGKSTLMKILCGIHRPDSGEMQLAGSPFSPPTPQVAQQAGVGVIHQEFNLIPELTVRENLFLGHEQGWLRPLSRRAETEQATAVFQRLRVSLPLESRISSLTVAQQQLVEIAKALLWESRLIVMDEPTAPLSPQEVAGLFDVIRELRQQGISIIYISHRLDEIFEICDRITVLRDGSEVATRPTAAVSRSELIELMVGRTLDQEFPARKSRIGKPRLVAEHLSRGRKVRDVSLTLHQGEIVALTGLVGAGRTEVARLLFGADRREAGTVKLNGRSLALSSPRAAIAAGICLLTEDRKSQGLVLGQPVLHNFSLPNLREFSRVWGLQQQRERAAFQQHQATLRIRLARPLQPTRTLSGGNQQKVVLAKWLQRNADVLIFDEPTRGIDVGARFEIYQLMHQLADQGKSILMISSELPEVLGMADRILVMHAGRITGEITDAHQATQEQVMALAVQGDRE